MPWPSTMVISSGMVIWLMTCATRCAIGACEVTQGQAAGAWRPWAGLADAAPAAPAGTAKRAAAAAAARTAVARLALRNPRWRWKGR